MCEHTTETELNATARSIEQTIPCRCCLGHIRAWVQPALVTSKGQVVSPACLYVDCDNPTCALYRQTLSFEQWRSCDLSAYGASEHPAWAKAVQDAARQDTIKALVESLIVQHETDVRIREMVLADFREQVRYTLAYTRRDVCHAWLLLYTR